MEGLRERIRVRSPGDVDLEPPRQVRGLPEELLVPPVADAADRLRDQQAGRGASSSSGTFAPDRFAM